MAAQPPIRFSVIGINHDHIYGQVDLLLREGAEFIAFYAPEPELAARFGKVYPHARQARSEAEILEDSTIQLIVTAGIPHERAPLGIEAMRHGKDFMSDKPGITTLEQLARVRRVQAETGRIFSVCFSERTGSPVTIKAGELVRAGAIGQVVQTIGMGPHQIGLHKRPPWFFERDQHGGILCDIAAHQFDQFLFFTGSRTADIVASQVANYTHPEYPNFEDFGDAMIQGDAGTGYCRVDWYTPNGLGVWGDGRMMILGTDGYIELRKNINLGGDEKRDRLFLVDHDSIQNVDCSNVELPYGRELIHDILDRSQPELSQEQCFLACELALKAEAQAQRLGHLAQPLQ